MLRPTTAVVTVFCASLVVLGLVGCSTSTDPEPEGGSPTDSSAVDPVEAEGEALEAAVAEAAAKDPRAPEAADITKDFLAALFTRDCETFEALSTERARDLVVGEFGGPPSGYWGCEALDWAHIGLEESEQEFEVTFMDLTSELRQQDGGAHVVVHEHQEGPDRLFDYRWDVILLPDEQDALTVNVALRERW